MTINKQLHIRLERWSLETRKQTVAGWMLWRPVVVFSRNKHPRMRTTRSLCHSLCIFLKGFPKTLVFLCPQGQFSIFPIVEKIYIVYICTVCYDLQALTKLLYKSFHSSMSHSISLLWTPLLYQNINVAHQQPPFIYLLSTSLCHFLVFDLQAVSHERTCSHQPQFSPCKSHTWFGF